MSLSNHHSTPSSISSVHPNNFHSLELHQMGVACIRLAAADWKAAIQNDNSLLDAINSNPSTLWADSFPPEGLTSPGELPPFTTDRPFPTPNTMNHQHLHNFHPVDPFQAIPPPHHRPAPTNPTPIMMEPSATTILADLASLSSREKEHSNVYRIWSILGVMDYWSRDKSSEEDLSFLHLSAPMARLNVYDCSNPSKTPSPLPQDKKKHLICVSFQQQLESLTPRKTSQRPSPYGCQHFKSEVYGPILQPFIHKTPKPNWRSQQALQ